MNNTGYNAVFKNILIIEFYLLFSSAIIHTLSKQIEEARETLTKERTER